MKLWCQEKLRSWKEFCSRLHQFFRKNHWISHAESSSSYINNDLHTFSSLQILSKWKMGWIKKAILFYFVVVFWFQRQPCELESTPSRQQMDSIKGSHNKMVTHVSNKVLHIIRGDTRLPSSPSFALSLSYHVSSSQSFQSASRSDWHRGEGAVIWALRIRTPARPGEISPFGLNLAW